MILGLSRNANMSSESRGAVGRLGAPLHEPLQEAREAPNQAPKSGGTGAERRRRGESVRSRAVPEAFVHRLRVRYSECDPQGVVFNANYLTYFDIALTELWREAIGPYAQMTEGGVDMVVAEARARYLAPARFDELLGIAVTPTRLGT